MRKTIPRFISRHLSTLRFPRLFALTALVFGADLFFPDVIPFVDEILLGLGTALLGSWKRAQDAGPRRAIGSESETRRPEDDERDEPL